ncbi:MAG: SDR family oxidoreductase, partial [Chloracidobacterium sp.]
MSGLMLADKKGVVLGVANKRSIAWGIAQAAANAGATLALNYQNERLEANVRELAVTLQNPLVLPCDVTNDADIETFFAQVQSKFGALDFLVHAVAYAPKEDLEGQFIDTSREG